MLAKVLILALAATAFALKKQTKMKLPNCKKADGKIKRQLQSISPMRIPHTAELKSEGYGADHQLVKIFYINQDRAVKRKATMEKKLKPWADLYEIERFQAVKPEEARHKDIKLVSTGHQNAEVNGKKLATYFSHSLILKHIANQTNHTAHDHTDVYFVLEDDIEFKRKDWIDQVMCHVNKLPADWDMYKFGYWEEVSKERNGACGLPSKNSQSGANYETLVNHNQFSCFQQTANVDTQQWMGNQGYAITPAGAAHMLQHLAHMPVMDVDGAMMPHGGQRRYAPNNYYSKETMLGHDTEVNMATVRNVIS